APQDDMPQDSPTSAVVQQDCSELPANLVGHYAGNYRLDALLGSGASGNVYLGINPKIGTKAAIKVLHAEVAANEELVARFMREARTTTAIASTAIARYFDFGELADGRTYAVMEYVPGRSLEEHLASGTFSVDDVRHILLQCAEALSLAHEAGVVHRDIKPENILCSPEDGVVRILDFGIAKVPQSGDARATQTGVFLGSPAHCAPEQIYGALPTPATDVYALASTAFELLTGEAPYREDEVDRLLRRKISGPVVDIHQRAPWLPAEVADTLQRALATEPERRTPSMPALLDELRRWSAVGEVREPEPPDTPRPSPPANLEEPVWMALPYRITRWAIAGALVTVIGTAALVVGLATSSPEPPEERFDPGAPSAEPAPAPLAPTATLPLGATTPAAREEAAATTMNGRRRRLPPAKQLRRAAARTMRAVNTTRAETATKATPRPASPAPSAMGARISDPFADSPSRFADPFAE
ncbi:MAG: serine/threonine-protein kinase, partial [Myxococcota bacterium]